MATRTKETDFIWTPDTKLQWPKHSKASFEYYDGGDFYIGNKVSEKYDELGFVMFCSDDESYNPAHRPFKTPGPVTPPEKFKEILQRVEGALISINEGPNCVTPFESNNIYIYPKEAYQLEADRHCNIDQQYETVLAHELIHLTGTPGRLRRGTLKNYYGMSRKREECVAIAGSKLLLEKLGYVLNTETLERHDRLLASWEQGLMWPQIVRTRRKAKEAVNYLLTGEIKWYKRLMNKLMKT